jgi:uncharacterized protein YeaO (DUF488 family)
MTLRRMARATGSWSIASGPWGVKKEDAALYEWNKDVAPSVELRRWYGHDPAKFGELTRRYRDDYLGRQRQRPSRISGASPASSASPPLATSTTPAPESSTSIAG